jgi:hypothetical protein
MRVKRAYAIYKELNVINVPTILHNYENKSR